MNERFAATVLARRRAIVVVLVGAAALCSLALPQLGVRFAPEELVAADEETQRAEARVRAELGPEEVALVVVIQAERVVEPEVLGWIHRFAWSLREEPGVERVESLSTSPLPRALEPVDDEEITLDALEGAETPPSAAELAMQDAVGRAIATDVERFPLGLASLAERGVGRIEFGPLLPMREPTRAELERAGVAAEASSLLRGRLISPRGDVTVIAAICAADAPEQDVDALVLRAAEWLHASPAPAGVEAHVTGLPAMRSEMLSALRGDQLRLVLLAAVGSLFVLLVGMRSTAGVALPMATVGLALAITLGTMALAGQPITLLTNVVPPLLLTIGLSDAVHLVLRYRDELAAGGSDRVAAARRTLKAMGLPCLVTSLTTALGFAALMLTETPALRRFGAITAAATMLTWLVTVLFVPAMLPAFSARERIHQSPTLARGLGLLDRFVVSLARFAVTRPALPLLGAGLLFGGALILARGVSIDSRLLDQFAEGSELAQSTQLLERELDGVRSASIVLRAEPGFFLRPEGVVAMEAVRAEAQRAPEVLRATTPSEWLRDGWATLTQESSARAEPLASAARIEALRELLRSADRDPLARYLCADASCARLELRLVDAGAQRTLSLVDVLTERARSLGMEADATGEAVRASRGLVRITRSASSLGVAAIAIFALMTALFRSLRLGLLAIPPNVLPLALTVGYMALRGIPLHAATVIVFTVTVGLSVDGATHVLSRYREAGQPSSVAGIVETMRASGRGVVLSSLTLLLGYAALLTSAFEPVRLFGELSAVAIGSALLAQLVMLPALLVVSAPRAAR